MIRYSSNTFRHRIALLCDGAKIRPEPSSNRGNQPRFAVFCAENIMDPNRAKGVGHRETYRIIKITTCKYVLYYYYAFTPALRDGILFLYWNTGAEAPAYFLSASPRRWRAFEGQRNPPVPGKRRELNTLRLDSGWRASGIP